MKKFAIVVAGGSGVRMGTPLPKQFLSLRERPVLWYTLDTFLAAFDDLRIVLVIPAAFRRLAEELLGTLRQADRVELVEGGNTRFHSVRNGLGRISEILGTGPLNAASDAGGGAGGRAMVPDAGAGGGSDAIIFVHDGVRCLVSGGLIRRCYEQTLRLGSAVPVVDCRDSVRLAEDEGRSKPIDRSRIKLVQTPQTFRADILIAAYSRDHSKAFTDEATVAEEAGFAVHLIEGEINNIKITTPTDLALAGLLLP
ncbi:MAG TPA: 2-C-methyl-D-erythritol 4-phosphate cytidylyltransferase [Puia sp.]|nr:2-C-methyl-D-erythritol 4-phosphate cytidylyltransferase [Puia sp.]